MLFHCTNIPQFLSPFFTHRHWGCFCTPASVNNAAVNMAVNTSFLISNLLFLWFYTRTVCFDLPMNLSISWPLLHLFTSLFHLFYLGGSDGKESACNVRDPGLIPWVGKIPWRRAWQPTLVFLPGESHGQRRAWWATVYETAKSQTWLSD